MEQMAGVWHGAMLCSTKFLITSEIISFIIYVVLLIKMITFATFVKFFVEKGYH